MVAAPTGDQETAAGKLVGQLVHAGDRPDVRSWSVLQIAEPITDVSVDPGLEDDELGTELTQEWRHDPFEERQKGLVAHAGRQRDVDLESSPVAPAGLVEGSGAGEDRASVLVEIDVEDPSVVIEPIHHSVPVMHINIHIRDPADPRPRLQGGPDGQRGIVEDAEPARAVGARVVQPSGGVEGVGLWGCPDDPPPEQGPPRDPRRGLVAARERGGVSRVQNSGNLLGASPGDEGEIVGLVKAPQLFGGGDGGLTDLDRGADSHVEESTLFQQPDGKATTALGERVTRPEVVPVEVRIPDDLEGTDPRRHPHRPETACYTTGGKGVLRGPGFERSHSTVLGKAWWLPSGPFYPPQLLPASGETTTDPGLTPGESATLREACDAFVPLVEAPGPGREFFARRGTDLGVDRQIVELVGQQFSLRQMQQFRQLLRTFESPWANLFLGGRPIRFSRLGPERRAEYLRSWRDSALPLRRSGFQVLKRLICFLYYAAPGPGGMNPNWEEIGYSGRLGEPRTAHPEELRITPVEMDEELDTQSDVVVVGSGAGGSVAAYELQRAGYAVTVVESGEYWTSDTVGVSEFDMTNRAYEGAGTLATADVSFQLLAGHGAGGGTFVNWMTSLRPPAPILREWERAHGIPGLTGSEFAQDVEEVWRTLEVNDRESPRNPNNEALWRGSVALGYREGQDFRTIFRNAVGCRGRCDFCGYGCPYACKRSTVMNYLPQAYRAGAKFLFRTRAESIELDGKRFRTVHAVHRTPLGREIPVRLRCRLVVLAGGAIHTPALLLRSGLNARPIGRGLRLHPTTAVAGEFVDEVRTWVGPPQTAAVTRFLDLEGSGHGFWMEAAPAHPGLFAMSVPWEDGRRHKEWMRDRFRRSTASIVLLRERSQGRVALDAHGAPRVTYRLNRADREEVIRGIVETGRVLAAAGARSLVTIHSAPLEVRARADQLSASEFDQFADAVASRGVGPNRVLMFSAHLMGSCPMGADPHSAAVRPSGELWTAENLFVADASVFPSSPGVNPMITIMSMARRAARCAIDRLRSAPR